MRGGKGRSKGKPVPEAVRLGAWASRGEAMAGSQLSIKDKTSPPAVEGKPGLYCPPPTPPDRRKPFAARLTSEKLGWAIMEWDALLVP